MRCLDAGVAMVRRTFLLHQFYIVTMTCYKMGNVILCETNVAKILSEGEWVKEVNNGTMCSYYYYCHRCRCAECGEWVACRKSVCNKSLKILFDMEPINNNCCIYSTSNFRTLFVEWNESAPNDLLNIWKCNACHPEIVSLSTKMSFIKTTIRRPHIKYMKCWKFIARMQREIEIVVSANACVVIRMIGDGSSRPACTLRTLPIS